MGDAKESLKQLLPLLNKKTYPEWLQKFKELYAIEFEKVIKNDLHPVKEGLTMGEVLYEINQETKGEAAIRITSYNVCYTKLLRNVLLTIDRIHEESPILSEMEKNGEIMIIGAMYDINTGAVDFFE